MGVRVRLLVPTVGSAQNEVVGLPEESAADLVANGKAVYVDPEPEPDAPAKPAAKKAAAKKG